MRSKIFLGIIIFVYCILPQLILAKENWGLRDLSYKINKAKKAFYSFYQITFEGNKIQELKKNLSLNEEILRYLIIKVKEHDELPTKLLKNKE